METADPQAAIPAAPILSAGLIYARHVETLHRELWAKKYAPIWEAEEAADEQRRAEAMTDFPVTVGAYTFRRMTAWDWWQLDLAGSVFVCGGIPDSAGLAFVIWFLQAEEKPALFGGWHKRRFIAKLARRYWHGAKDDVPNDAYFRDLAEVQHYFAETFADLRTGSIEGGASKPSSRPLGVNFLAPLLILLACEFGADDPLTGQPLAHTPLTRLWQYRKVIAQRQAAAFGNKYTETSASDRLKSECAAEVQSILDAENAAKTTAAA